MKANELAFFGRISASVTHELKNVLAIINESNGLMGDLLGILKKVEVPYRERFERSIRKIEEQVRRGVEITSRFNRFAHSIDYPSIDVDLNSIVTLTVSLAQRFASLQNVELRGGLCDRSIILHTNAFRLQMALTRLIEAFIRCMSGSGSILMMVRDDPDIAGIDFCFEDESCHDFAEGAIEEFAEWQDFVELSSTLGIRYDWRSIDGCFAVFFSGLQGPERPESWE